MTAPRVVVDLDAIEGNTRVLVDRLGARGIRVTAVTKAALGSPAEWNWREWVPKNGYRGALAWRD